MTETSAPIDALLVLPHLRIQNANAISSPLTWGFPPMTAFIGLLQAIERRLPDEFSIGLCGAGVVCHDFETQATRSGFTHRFHLTRNPIDKDGDTAAIVEEGRIHLEVTLVFGVQFYDNFETSDAVAHAAQAQLVADLVAGMRIAGGSVLPSVYPQAARFRSRIVPLGSASDDRDKVFRNERRKWLPGFVLVSRDDLLAQRLTELRRTQPAASLLDAWLDLSRLNYRAERSTAIDPKSGQPTEQVDWLPQRPTGWIVPIPVGYGALSELYSAGTVAGARDLHTPFRFVESLYSMGQWISPHRLSRPSDLLWYPSSNPNSGLYRCANDYRPAPAPDIAVNV